MKSVFRARIFLLSSLCILFLLSLMVSCAVEKAPYTSTAHTSVTGGELKKTSADNPTSNTAEATSVITIPSNTTQAGLQNEIPTEFFEDNGVVHASKIVVLSEYNDIAYDINAYISKGDSTIWFFMPCRADLSRVVYRCYSSNGVATYTQVADFTDDKTENSEKIVYQGSRYTIKAMQSNAPSLFVSLDSNYPSFEEIRADRQKNTKGYGSAALQITDEMAERYGWDWLYQSVDRDPSSPLSASLKGRGNWSWLDVDKKGYLLKFENSLNLLGMGSAKKWVLIANVPDATALRNQIAFSLSQSIGLDFTTDSRTVDLYVCGDYIGSYLLLEKVEIDEDRVDIKDLEKETENESGDYGKEVIAKLSCGALAKYYTDVTNPDDISGGYIIEMDIEGRMMEEASYVKTTRGYCFSVISPEYISREQAEYIGTLIQELEDAIFSENGISPLSGKHYTELIDAESMALKYWVDEIMRNTDAQITSVFFYKPADSQDTRLKAGPPWDYDNTFAATYDSIFARYEGYYAAMLEHDDFASLVDEIYTSRVYPAIRSMIYDGVIDEMIENTQSSMEMNNIIWRNLGSISYTSLADDVMEYFTKRSSWFYHTIK